MADVELLPCAECGMPCRAGEYHPFAACLMFKACRNSETVRANLAPLQAENERLRAEVAEARGLVIEANNSLYGSQGYFHSLNGGAYDRHHLSRGIEDLKTSSRARYAAEARADRLAEALRALILAYVRLLESGRDRIKDLGGDCDPVDVMERGDIDLRQARAALAQEDRNG